MTRAGNFLGVPNFVPTSSCGVNIRIDGIGLRVDYNLAASALGVGRYQVEVSINGFFVGHAVFAVK